VTAKAGIEHSVPVNLNDLDLNSTLSDVPRCPALIIKESCALSRSIRLQSRCRSWSGDYELGPALLDRIALGLGKRDVALRIDLNRGIR
jgi:hypothetical protein